VDGPSRSTVRVLVDVLPQSIINDGQGVIPASKGWTSCWSESGVGAGRLAWGTPTVRPVRLRGWDEVRGNPVGVRDCPAAVSGNDRRHDALGVCLGSDGQ
jgi:hypothetical protein